MFLSKKILGCFICALVVANANADGVKMYSGNAPSAEEMGGILFSSQPSAMPKTGIKMRSISFGKPKSNEPPVVSAETANQQDSTIGLPIKFAYNSSQVLSESKPFLNEIGRMLSLPDFSSERLLIEGHTDSGGSANYNQYLSERRAQSVKRYLMDNFSIASNRMFITGMGEGQPLAGVNPSAGVNRRVQFRKAP